MDSKEMSAGRGSRLAENTAALTAAGAAQIFFTLVQLGILSRALGAERFGLFVAQKGFALLAATVMLLGLPQVLVRFLPSFQSRGQKGRAAAWFLVFCVAVGSIALTLHLTSESWSGIVPGFAAGGTGGEAFRWILLAAAATALKLLLYGGFAGLREMRMQMIFEMVYQVALTAWILAVRARVDIPTLFRMIAVLGASVFAAGLPVYMRFVSRMDGFASEDGGRIAIPSPAGYWGYALVLSLAALAFTDVDRFVMSSLLPLAAISVYHVSSRMNQLLKRFLGFPVVALQPELTRIYEEGRWSDLSGRILLFTKVTLVAALATTALAAAAGREVIILISGEEYAGAYWILLLLLPTVPAAALIAPLTTSMRALHFMGMAVVCDLAWMAVYLAGMFVLIPVLGLPGTAAAQLAATAAQAALALALARRIGFYGGAGGAGMLWVLAVSAVFALAGAAATFRWGLPAAAACIVLSPFVFRETVGRAGVFEPGEREMVATLVPPGAARKAVAWAMRGEGA